MPLNGGDEEEGEAEDTGLEAILATCRRLAHATASLMHWATAAQRELVKQGRLKPVSENVDESEAESQWTCGLVSAVSSSRRAILIEFDLPLISFAAHPPPSTGEVRFSGDGEPGRVRGDVGCRA